MSSLKNKDVGMFAIKPLNECSVKVMPNPVTWTLALAALSEYVQPLVTFS